MRTFNTSGTNIPARHYTLKRQSIINQGIKLVQEECYFTIWAPRQTGKSTCFRLLATDLEKMGYQVVHINFENYKTASLDSFLYTFTSEVKKKWRLNFSTEKELSKLFQLFTEVKNKKLILIIDKVEGINSEYFSEFLHSVRNAYHSRETHSLKSIILVGVSNITGIVQDNASPFNIADELAMPYFTDAETMELFAQHETETGQFFDDKVKRKISEITANQPGLVNGFAKILVDNNPKKRIDYQDYLNVEQTYLRRKIDKNVGNIIKIAKKHRKFVENLLFTGKTKPFSIHNPATEVLHANGLITWDEKNNIKFWVPLYKKALFDCFYPHANGESEYIAETMFVDEFLNTDEQINFDKLIGSYKQHIKLRSFRPYREKDENGKFKSIPEAAMIYSFETFISIFIQIIEGKIYREAHISLGNSDMIINVKGFGYFIETKKYYNPNNFQKGKRQIPYYCSRASIKRAFTLSISKIPFARSA